MRGYSKNGSSQDKAWESPWGSLRSHASPQPRICSDVPKVMPLWPVRVPALCHIVMQWGLRDTGRGDGRAPPHSLEV